MLTGIKCCSEHLLKISARLIGNACTFRSISIAKYPLGAGHSKWANIRHIKSAKDAQKSMLFTKMSRQIRLAIQEGGSADISLNSHLKSVVEEALRKNMPMATIQNNIQKFTQNKTELKRYRVDIRYKQKVFAVCIIYTEKYAGVKIEMATILRKGGANILEANNLFEEIGLVQATIDKSRLPKGSELEDIVTEDAITYGAEEVEVIDNDKGVVNFICRPFEMMVFRKQIEANGYVIDNTDHIYIPQRVVELLPEESMEYQKFVKKLKEIPGVEEIHDNVNAA